MHLVIRYHILLDGPEGSKSHMESDICKLYSLFFDLLKKLRSKMKSRGRRSCRSVIFCIYGIISGRICKLVCNIRRKRHLSESVQYFLEDTVKIKPDNPVSAFNNIKHFGLKNPVTEVKSLAGSAAFSGSYQSFPVGSRKPLKQKHLYMSACPFPYSEKSCGDNLCVIEHEAVTRIKIFRNVPEYFMFSFAGFSVNDHQP